jgi:intraflagellar transport protein 172
LKTIVLEDLVFGYSLGQVQHDSKIDWLELNETGRKLLFRDKRSRLNLVDVENGMAKSSILNYCTYVQWVPGSDVVVAQTRDQMAVFYNIEAAERVTLMPIKGDVTDVLREDGKTEVLVVEGQHQLSYELDEGLIEFGTAVDDGDFNRAIAYLESLELSPETEAMWRTLARMALEGRQLHVAERCYAALGDVAKARYLRETLDAAETAAENFGGDGTDAPEVWARLYVLDKQFKAAEGLYLEQNQLDEAIRMYRRLHMWDDALNLADAKAHPQLDQLRAEHMRWLLDTGQEEKAGAIREAEGDYNEALNLYLKGGLATRASRLLQSNGQMLSNDDSVARVTAALLKGEFFEQAGELYEHVQSPERALDCYRKAGAFSRAVELARRTFPAEVIRLEEEWGNHLAESKQLDAAISHFIEAGKTVRALDAAIGARQWKKAVQIAQVIEPDAANADLAKYYVKLAQHYASIKEYSVAQRFFLQADMPRSAVEMYNAAGMWEEAHKLASKYMDPKEVRGH